MNPIVIVHLAAAVAVVLASVPLIRRRVKMNPWYGVRIPAAFESEERWFEINAYGGRLLLRWGLVIAATAIVGAFLGREHWVVYDRTALAIICVGLAVVIVKIMRHSR